LEVKEKEIAAHPTEEPVDVAEDSGDSARQGQNQNSGSRSKPARKVSVVCVVAPRFEAEQGRTAA